MSLGKRGNEGLRGRDLHSGGAVASVPVGMAAVLLVKRPTKVEQDPKPVRVRAGLFRNRRSSDDSAHAGATVIGRLFAVVSCRRRLSGRVEGTGGIAFRCDLYVTGGAARVPAGH